MKKILIIFSVFTLGFIVRDFISIPSAKAEVAGMDFSALETDTDFRQAVESIVEDCHVVEDGQISC